MSGKLVGVLAVVLLVLAGGFWLLDWGGSPASENPPKTKSPEYVPQTTPEPTPNQIYETIKPKETPEITPSPEPKDPVEEYVDASVGVHTRGDKVYIPEYGVRGRIGSGAIDNGKVTSSILSVLNEQDQKILYYQQSDNYPDLGHLELISYPQRGDVIMKQNGKDIALMKYETWADFSVYQKTTCEPDINPERTKLLLIERYGNC